MIDQHLEAWLRNVLPGALQRIVSVALILAAGIGLIKLLTNLVRKALLRSRLEKAAHSIILGVVRVGLYLLLVINVAAALGIDITGVVALASVLTLAVSLALQNMLANVIGGFTLLSTHPFRAGDFVEIAGQSGTVQEINMSYTTLLTPDNKQISIPNSAVVAAQIVNYTSAGTRRVEIPVNAGYTAPVQKVLDALVQAGTADNVLLSPAPSAVITGYGDSAIGYCLRVWVKAEDYWDVYYALQQRIKEVFDQQEIEMTYPHLNVHMQ